MKNNPLNNRQKSIKFWSPFRQRGKNLLTHNAVNNTTTEYTSDLISVNDKIMNVQTLCILYISVFLRVSSVSKNLDNSFLERSFLYAAPTLRNNLDLDIRVLPFDSIEKNNQVTYLSIATL